MLIHGIMKWTTQKINRCIISTQTKLSAVPIIQCASPTTSNHTEILAHKQVIIVVLSSFIQTADNKIKYTIKIQILYFQL